MRKGRKEEEGANENQPGFSSSVVFFEKWNELKGNAER
jgi:hypothetical protein